jgi:hypothetical protein
VTDTVSQSRLAQYLNARVTVQYGGQALGFSDTGLLSYMDPVWVEVTKDKGERLLIPVVSIRHIKLLDQPKAAGDSATLLRPAAKRPGAASE